MKYKVGDKVRIRKDLKGGCDYGHTYFNEYMEGLCGNIVTIKSIRTDKAYRIEEDKGDYIWNEEMIEGYVFKEGNRALVSMDGEDWEERIYLFTDKNGLTICVDKLNEKNYNIGNWYSPCCWLHIKPLNKKDDEVNKAIKLLEEKGIIKDGKVLNI